MTGFLNELADVATAVWGAGVYALPVLAGLTGWTGRKAPLILAAVLLCIAFIVAQSAILVLGKDYTRWTGMDGLGLVVGPLIIAGAILCATIIHAAIGWIRHGRK